MTGGQRRFEWTEAALLALAGVHFLLLAPRLVYPDLNWSYPFPGGDGREWLANGLALAGEPVRYTGRVPLLPAVLAALHRGRALALFPLFQQAVMAGLAWAVYRLLRAPCGRGAALALGVATLLSHAWRASALEIMAEPLAVLLLTLASAAFLGAAVAPRRYLAAGLWVGLGALAQPVVSLMALPALGLILARRRTHLRSRALWSGAALGLLPPALWMALGPAGAGGAGIVGARQLALLEPQLDGAGFYAAALLDLIGWPGLAAALLALGRRRSDATLFAAGLALALGGFFVFLYDYRAARFLIYLWPAWALLAGQGLAALRDRRVGKPVLWQAAACAVILGAVWPPAAGWSGPAAWAARPEAQAFAAPRAAARADPPPDAALHTGDQSVVFLEPAGATAEERYAIQYRLGNALRQRVKVVPQTLYPENWWGWSFARRVQETASLALLRWQPPGDSRRWTLALPSSSAPRSLGRQPPGESMPPPETLARQWRIASRIDALVAGPDGFVAVCPSPGPAPEWLRLLPFALRSSSLFVISDRALCDGWAVGEAVPSPDPEVRIHRGRHLGWPVLAVFPEGE